MSAATADSGDDEVHSRSQQPMLASQRHKAGNDTPTEENRSGRFGRYFTLGYKEGFNQWVCMNTLNTGDKLTVKVGEHSSC